MTSPINPNTSGMVQLLKRLSPNTAIPDIDIGGDEQALRKAERLRDWVAQADRVLALNSVDTYLLALRMAIIGLIVLAGVNIFYTSMTTELAVAVGFSAVVCVMLYVSVRRNNKLSHWERWVPNIYLLLPHSYGLYVNGSYASSVTLAVIMGAYMTLPRYSARVLTAWYLTAFVALWARGASDPDLLLRQSLTILISVMFLDALTGRISSIVSFMRDLLNNLQTLRESVDNEYLEHRNDFARLQRFRAQLDLAREMLLIVRLSDGRLVDCNRAAEHLSGHSRMELLEMHLWQLVEKTGTEEAYFDLLPRLSDARELRDQSALRVSDGGRIPIEIAMTVEHTSDLMLVLARDISQQIATEQALSRSKQSADAARLDAERALARAEMASAAKSRFLTSMGHEIRTPLQGINGALKLLQSSATDERSQRYIDGAMKASDGLMAMLTDVLDFANAESGDLDLVRERFAPAQLATELEERFGPACSRKNLSLSIKGAGDLPPVLIGDVGRIRRICEHLLDNAVRYTVNGSVKLSFSIEPGDSTTALPSALLRATVSDTGPGIAPERQSTVFEGLTPHPAFTADSGELGMGLALCRRLARLMGGNLSLSSMPGVGTTVELSLLLGLPEDGGTRRERPLPITPAAGQRRFVVAAIDDNEESLDLIREALLPLGVEIALRSNPVEAVRDILDGRLAADLVCMDVRMHGLNGIDATIELRTSLGPDQLPIIGITGDASPTTRNECMLAGMNSVLTKPFDIESFEQQVMRFIPH